VFKIFGFVLCVMSFAQASDLQQKIQNNLNGVKALTADMVQQNPDGSVEKGRLFLKRPQLCVQYIENGKTTKQKIIANRDTLTLTGKDGSQDIVGVKDTPAGLLLQEKLDFKNDLELSLISQTEQSAQFRLQKKGQNEGLFITLKFSIKPMILLQGWIIDGGVKEDGSRQTTEVTLENVKIGIDIDDLVFKDN
jgi:outer membrane lipoprotein-sorting protein